MSSMRAAVRTWETQESGEVRRLRCPGGAHWFTSREAFNRHARTCGGRPGGTPAEGKPS
jgi:hypothetical protein